MGVPQFDLSYANGLLGDIEQLIVLGNGFDLQCELPSRFADFMAERLPKLNNLEYGIDSWRRVLFGESITVWDFILGSRRASDWCDIEAAIAEWIVGEDHWHLFWNSINAIKADPFSFAHVSQRRNGRPWSEDTDEKHCLGNIARTYIAQHPAWRDNPPTDKAFAAFLLEELNRLEQAFSVYLLAALDADPDYQDRSARFLHCLIWDGVPPHGYNANIVSLLNFNYTDPFRYPFAESGWEKVNIHGTLNEGIIFGIDGKECMDDPIALPFTKTYRVVSQGVQLARPLVQPAGIVASEPGTAVIKFYGHSLGEADYSYFQSIFDGVDLYGGTTELVFYYKPCKDVSPKEEQACRSRMVSAVSHLLNTYGSTLDNKDHGKNLMHKLLLEGRITIKEAPTTFTIPD